MTHSSEISIGIKKLEQERQAINKQIANSASTNCPKEKLLSKKKWMNGKIEQMQLDLLKAIKNEEIDRKDYEANRNDRFVGALEVLMETNRKLVSILGGMDLEVKQIRRHLEYLQTGSKTI